MESNMVKEETLLYPQDCVSLVIKFFSQELVNFKLTKSGNYMGYWWVEYKDEEKDIIIYFDGDIGHHFCISIIIANTKYFLWQFNKSVNHMTLSTKTNIECQLSILRKFLT
jgi:hypothetical protein